MPHVALLFVVTEFFVDDFAVFLIRQAEQDHEIAKDNNCDDEEQAPVDFIVEPLLDEAVSRTMAKLELIL